MHLAHVLDDADGLLDRLADQVFDLEGRCAFVVGAPSASDTKDPAED